MRWSSLFALLLVFAATPPAAAQPTGDDTQPGAGALTDGERAIELGTAAVKLYDAERYAEAHDKFSEGEQLMHSPVFLLYMARCKNKLDELIAARALYRRAAEESVSPDAPKPWHAAKQDAAAELELANAAQPRLRVVAPREAVVRIDGRVLSRAERAAELELDPGEHIIEGSREGVAPQREVVRLERGARRDLALALEPAAVAAEPTPSSAQTAPPNIEARHGSLLPGALVLGGGVAFGIVGGVLGGVALSKASAVTDQCVADDCTAGGGSAGQQLVEDRDDARALAHASTGLLVVAGVVATVGIVLMIVRPGAVEQNGAVRFEPARMTLRF